jgi:hypothetical protein
MLFPKYVLEDLLVGSGSIIGKRNIEEFFNHISMHKDVEDRSLAELAPSYEVAAAYLVHMLEVKFVSLNPFMQQMFLKLHDIEDSKKKGFILETLRVVIEARKVFEHFNMLGSPVNVVGTTKEDCASDAGKLKKTIGSGGEDGIIAGFVLFASKRKKTTTTFWCIAVSPFGFGSYSRSGLVSTACIQDNGRV